MPNVCGDILRRTREGQNLSKLPVFGPVRLVIASGSPRSGVQLDVPARKTFLVAWLALRLPQNSHRSGHDIAGYLAQIRCVSSGQNPRFLAPRT